VPFVFLLAGGIAAGGAALFLLGVGRAGDVGGVERGFDSDWKRAGLFLAAEGKGVCEFGFAAGWDQGCDGVIAVDKAHVLPTLHGGATFSFLRT